MGRWFRSAEKLPRRAGVQSKPRGREHWRRGASRDRVPNVRLLAAPGSALVPGVPPLGVRLPGTGGVVASRIAHGCFLLRRLLGPRQPRHGLAKALAQVLHGGVQILACPRRPQVQGIAAGAAHEAVIDVLAQVRREGAAGRRVSRATGTVRAVARRGACAAGSRSSSERRPGPGRRGPPDSRSPA